MIRLTLPISDIEDGTIVHILEDDQDYMLRKPKCGGALLAPVHGPEKGTPIPFDTMLEVHFETMTELWMYVSSAKVVPISDYTLGLIAKGFFAEERPKDVAEKDLFETLKSVRDLPVVPPKPVSKYQYIKQTATDFSHYTKDGKTMSSADIINDLNNYASMQEIEPAPKPISQRTQYRSHLDNNRAWFSKNGVVMMPADILNVLNDHASMETIHD